MGRSFSNAKAVYAVVTNRVSAVRAGTPSTMFRKGAEEPTKVSWVPDPVTGYYRPETHAKEANDAADLRAILLLKNQNKIGQD